VNDVAMAGAVPIALSASFIIEEGLPLADLKRIVQSMAAASKEAGVPIVTGDTKVVEKGKGDGLFISTTGIGLVPEGLEISGDKARPGDVILVSGTMGDHGVAVMRDPTRGGLAATLNEMATQSGVGMMIYEAKIPVRPEVNGACELLGLDPLYVANEGKLIAICPGDQAERLLAVMRAHPLGADAAIIGEVIPDDHHFVQMETAFGGKRVVDWLAGEQLPRIC